MSFRLDKRYIAARGTRAHAPRPGCCTPWDSWFMWSCCALQWANP